MTQTDRLPPWRYAGTRIDTAMTVAEALEFGGLDYNVVPRPTGYLDIDGQFVASPTRWKLIREDTGRVFGEVGRTYKIMQNVEALSVADQLMEYMDLYIDSVGSYRGGARAFLVLMFRNDVMVCGLDPHRTALVLSTGHGGEETTRVTLTMLRLANMTMSPLDLGYGVKREWEIWHNSGAVGSISKINKSVPMVMKAVNSYTKAMDRLVRSRLKDADLRLAVHSVTVKTRQNMVKSQLRKASLVSEIFQNQEDLEPYRGSRYAGLQAFNEWMDWQRPMTGDPDARFTVSFDGPGAIERNKLYKMLMGY